MRENYWTKRRRYNRRTMLKAGAAGTVGAGAFALVGCGDDDEDDVASDPTGTPAPTEPAQTMGALDGSFASFYQGIDGTTNDLHRELYRSHVYAYGHAYNNLLKFTDMENFVIEGEISRGLPEQPDELTYQFEIRDDVKWHNKTPANGRALTMDDIRWNLERQRTMSRADGTEDTTFFRHPLMYKNMERIDYIDETHFTITMKSPQVTWLGDFTDEFNGIQYPDVTEALEDDATFGDINADNIVGTGPFIYDEFIAQDKAHAVRNDEYFFRKDGTIPGMVDELFITNVGTDPNPQRLAFEQKQIDELITTRDISDDIVASNSDVELIRYGNPNSNLEFAYNYTTNRALSDERIRTAMFLATDRGLVAEQEFQGLARPNAGVNWPFTSWALPQDELAEAPGYRTPKDQDIADARRLWEEADAEGHLEEDFLLTTVGSSPQRVALQEWFPAMLNENLNTSQWGMQNIPVTSLLEYNNSGQASVGYIGGWDQWTSPDPRTRFAQVYSAHPEEGGRGTINFWHYTTPTMEGFIDKLFSEFDSTVAQEVIKDAQRFILTDAGSGHLQMVGGLQSYLKWPYLHRRGPFFITYGTDMDRELWIDQNDPTFSGKTKPA